MLFKSSRNAANIALRHSKKEYYIKKFSDNKQNPKKAWRTINDVLGRNRKHSTINEIKLQGNQIYEYFDQQNLFSKHQFGFRPYHSTTIQRYWIVRTNGMPTWTGAFIT